MSKSFLEVDDLTKSELHRVLELCLDPDPPKVLRGQGIALIFEKPSNRTRNSMEMAAYQLGGHPVYIRGEEIGLDEERVSRRRSYNSFCLLQMHRSESFCPQNAREDGRNKSLSDNQPSF